MNKSLNVRTLLIMLTLVGMIFSSYTSTAQSVSGKIIDAKTKQPIPLVNITIPTYSTLKAKIGTSANEKGEFTIEIDGGLPVELEFSRVGFLNTKVFISKFQDDLIVEMVEDFTTLDDVTVTSEKVTIEELRAPIDIQKLDLRTIQYTPSFNFYDAIGNLKGVDMATQSTIINNVNARGFNSNSNPRFRQFIDGIDTQAPGLSFSLGNVIGPSSLDIETIKVIPGPSTSFYGPTAFNGILEMQTKSPFDFQGFSFSVKGASAAIEESNRDFISFGNNTTELSARYAYAYKDKIGIKVSGTMIQGVDFRARNYDNKGPGFRFEQEHSFRNQGIDGINVYGDDRPLVMVLPKNTSAPDAADTAFFLTRTGYQEGDLVNYDARNYKFNAQLSYKIAPETEFSLTAQYGLADAMITGVDRIALRDFEITQYKAELESKRFLLRAYTTTQNSGNTYNAGALGEEIVQSGKSDAVWFQQYRTTYINGPGGRQGLDFARVRTDTPTPGLFAGRIDPESAEFDSTRTAILNNNTLANGVNINDQSSLSHVDARYSFKEDQELLKDLFIGASYRFYNPESNGTVFVDSASNDLTNYEYGIYVEGIKEIDKKTDLTLSLRYDQNENFDPKLNQRLSVVRSYKQDHYFRASFSRGFRFPTVREQFQNQNLGDVILIGGLPEVTNNFDLIGNSFLQSALTDYNARVFEAVNINGDRYAQAQSQFLDIIQNDIVTAADFDRLEPERITTLEFGYRSLVQDRRIFEVTVYRNYYQNFIGNRRLVKPRTSPSVDLQRSIDQANNPATSDLIFVADNSESNIVTQGVELLYDITGLSGLNFSVNGTFSNIIQDANDPIIPGFNTAPFKWNVTFGHRRISRNIGGSMSWRSRTVFNWESPFADGAVDDFSTFDMQLTFRLPEIDSQIRLGANNIYNIDQYNTFGGPEISAFYYLSFTFDPFQRN